MKKLFFSFALLTILGLSVNAQTNVSGGIYSNTTWTLANSPYIVTDTIVVFTGVTLTIEPGVVVKFDSNMYIELRQASLIAQGTAMDSITFTSNSTSRSAGYWGQITQTGTGSHTCKFSYCSFKYANVGFSDYGATDSVFFKHSNFNYNNVGMYGDGGLSFLDSCNFNNNTMFGMEAVTGISINYCNISHNPTGFDGVVGKNLNNCVIEYNQTGIKDITGSNLNNCTIRNNQYGFYLTAGGGNIINNCMVDSNTVAGIYFNDNGEEVINCNIKYNGIGINSDQGFIITKNIIENNTVGIEIRSNTQNNSIYCNMICNNTTYDLESNSPNNVNLPNNYFCTTDSAATAAVIYDGYDNINLGFINFMPLDTLQCYLYSGIPVVGFQYLSFNIYPNPSTNNITIESPQQATIEITNIQGQLIQNLTTTGNKTNIDVSALAKGMYFIKVKTEKTVESRKFIKE